MNQEMIQTYIDKLLSLVKEQIAKILLLEVRLESLLKKSKETDEELEDLKSEIEILNAKIKDYEKRFGKVEVETTGSNTNVSSSDYK